MGGLRPSLFLYSPDLIWRPILPVKTIKKHCDRLPGPAINMRDFTFDASPQAFLLTCWGVRNYACSGLFLEQMNGRIEPRDPLVFSFTHSTKSIRRGDDAFSFTSKLISHALVGQFTEQWQKSQNNRRSRVLMCTIDACSCSWSSRGSWTPPSYSLIGR